MPLPSNPYRCTTHPALEAAWECVECLRLLCPDCAAQGSVNEVLFECCAHCDGPVRRLTVTGSAATYGSVLIETVRFPVGWVGVAVATAIFVAFIAMRDLGTVASGAVLLLGLAPAFWALFFAVLRAAARGADAVQTTVSTELLREVVFPALRAVALTAAGAALVLAFRGTEAGRNGMAHEHPELWWMLAGAALCLPSWTITLASGHGLLRVFDPRVVVRTMRSLGGDYAIAAVLTFAVASLCLFWSGVAGFMAREDATPFAILLRTLALFALVFVARFIGLLLSVRGDAVGYGLRFERQIPVLPEARPRAARRAIGDT